MKYIKNYCEEKGISTSELNESQRTLYYIAENMKMDKSISEEGYRHFQMAIQALEQKWIPVSERLPKTRDEVLIFLANGQITIASYNDHILPFFDKSIGWQVDPKRFVFYFCSDDVIAWMPLPEPYKEGEADDE